MQEDLISHTYTLSATQPGGSFANDWDTSMSEIGLASRDCLMLLLRCVLFVLPCSICGKNQVSWNLKRTWVTCLYSCVQKMQSLTFFSTVFSANLKPITITSPPWEPAASGTNHHHRVPQTKGHWSSLEKDAWRFGTDSATAKIKQQTNKQVRRVWLSRQDSRFEARVSAKLIILFGNMTSEVLSEFLSTKSDTFLLLVQPLTSVTEWLLR